MTLREAILIVHPNINIDDLQAKHPELTSQALDCSTCVILEDNTIVVHIGEPLFELPDFDMHTLKVPEMIDYKAIVKEERHIARRQQREQFKYMSKMHSRKQCGKLGK